MTDNKLAREAGFDVLGKGIYLKRPLSNCGAQVQEEGKIHPTVILIFGWMGARLPHLLKYTQGYEKLYPSATVILVRCGPVSFWMPQWMQIASLRPVVEALKALGCVSSSKDNDANKMKHRILIQAFSNGGCLQLTALSRGLAQYPRTNVSAGAVIFDSCPGIGSLSSITRAFSSIIRFLPLRALVLLHMYVMYFLMSVRKRVFGIPLYWEVIRTYINRPHFLPWLHKNSPRLYIYSTGDNLIPWRDVESHAKDAERIYNDVRKERFEGSMHVAHLKHDPDRYWRAVQDLWHAAC